MSDDREAHALAERYIAMLAAVSQCARAARDGDWRFLSEQAQSVAETAQQLSLTAAHAGSNSPTADSVLSLTSAASGVEAVRALHPPQGGRLAQYRPTP